MTSAILPTQNWTPTVADTTDVIDEPGEFIIVCGESDDHVVEAAPNWVTVVPAGEPDGCSGKAYALATGVESATDGGFVGTDDDVDRDSAWLSRLSTHAGTHGAATTYVWQSKLDVTVSS